MLLIFTAGLQRKPMDFYGSPKLARCCELISLIYLQTENFFNTFLIFEKTEGETRVHELVIMISAIINILLRLI